VEASIKVSFFEQRTPYKYKSRLHYIFYSTPRIRMCAKRKRVKMRVTLKYPSYTVVYFVKGRDKVEVQSAHAKSATF
jgi:hypothetical protein